MENKQDLLEKTPFKAMLTLAIPAIMEQIMLTMVQYVDTAMVGSLGSNATASIGITASVTWLFGGFMGASAVGFSVQVAQYIGARLFDEAKNVVRQGLLFCLFFGILISSIAFGLSFPLPRMMGAEASIIPDASLYFRIMACAMPFSLLSSLMGAMIRCSGDTRTPMFLNICVQVLNVILNYLFIYSTRQVSLLGLNFTMWGWGKGVAGAALASAISTGVISMVFLLVLFRKESPIRLHLGEKFAFTKECLSTTLRVGLPVALERSALCVAQVVITRIISTLGTIAVAANHLAVTAEAMSYLPADGMAIAATTLVGQALGAEKHQEALRYGRMCVHSGMIIMSMTGVLLYVLAPQLIMIFNREPAVVELGARVLRIEAFAQPLFAAAIVCTGVLRGAGDSRSPFIFNLISMWGVRITIAAITAPVLGLVGVWLAMCIELCVRGSIFLIRLYRGRWALTQRIISTSK